MSTESSRMTERIAVVATIDPASIGTGASNSDVIDMRYWRRVVFTIITGVLGSSATVDFEIDGDTASNGSFATKITDKSITQLVKASNDNDQVRIEVTAEEVAAQDKRYIRGKLTVGAASSIVCVLAEAEPAHNSADVTGQDLASVVEIVA